MMFFSFLRRFARDSRGNFAIPTALILLPAAALVGMAIDYTLLSAARERLQMDLDAAVIGSLQPLSAGDRTRAMSEAMSFMRGQASQTDLYELGTINATQKSATTLSFTVTANATPYFSSLFGISSFSLSASADATAGSTLNEYYELTIVLDKTASMLLAATPEDQAKMQLLPLMTEFTADETQTCVFACHDPQFYGTYEGVRYNSAYEFARAQNILLRTDVQSQAVSALLDQIDQLDPLHRLVKINIFTFGLNANNRWFNFTMWYGTLENPDGIRRIIGPTSDTSAIRRELSSNPLLTSQRSFDTSDFRDLRGLSRQVGAAGDGTAPSSPKKAVILITDGVHSSTHWVWSGTPMITPLNPAWCDPVKQLGAKFAVLNTEYPTLRGTDRYDATLGMSMSASEYRRVWLGVLPSPPSMTRAAFLPQALAACASSPDLYQSATAPDDIKNALLTLAGKTLGAVAPRLSQ